MIRLPDWMAGSVFQRAWDRWEGSIRLQTKRDLEKSQWLSPEKLAVLRSRRLGDLVRHAVASSPFYRERFAQAGIDPAAVLTIEDLAELPLLTKDDIRSRTPEILSDRFDRDQLWLSKTGGSTGVALEVWADPRCVQMRNGAALRTDEWSGWRLGQPLAAVWGNPPVPRTWRNRLRWALKDRVIYLDTMNIDDRAIEEFVTAWRHWRPGLLYGHAHSIFILAEALQDIERGLRPAGIVATSMMLLSSERSVIQEVFKTPVTDRYGCEEVSLIACECEHHQGMHFNAEHNWVEILRDDGTPCAPGEDGRIVVTELINFGMPMIRYEVGDRGVATARLCPCGRGLPLLDRLTGRVADFLVAESGSRVAGISLIENTLTRLPGIRQMQLVQDRRDRVQANLVPGTGYDSVVKEELVSSLRSYLGQSCDVDIVEVDKIPQDKSGKYRFSICRIEA